MRLFIYTKYIFVLFIFYTCIHNIIICQQLIRTSNFIRKNLDFMLKSITSDKRRLEHVFISGGNHHLTSRICGFVLGPTTSSNMVLEFPPKSIRPYAIRYPSKQLWKYSVAPNKEIYTNWQKSAIFFTLNFLPYKLLQIPENILQLIHWCAE